MLCIGSTDRRPIHFDSNGNPRFYRAAYTYSEGVSSLAFPVNYCNYHTSTNYPNTDRVEWQSSTIQYKSDSAVCLGNKGMACIYWPNGCNCHVTFNRATGLFTDGANATAVDYYSTACVSIAKIADNSNYIYVASNPWVRYRNGVAGSALLIDNINADDFVLTEPQYSGIIPDELGNGQASGGASYPYISAEILVEIPTDYVGELFADIVAYNRVDDSRPSLQFDDYFIYPTTSSKLHNRIVADWQQYGRRFVILEVLRQCNVSRVGEFVHVFAPYVLFLDTVGTERTYTIHDMTLLFRLVDTIRIGAT